ncbi:MAG: porin, partial [Planctomycetota bacterium]
AAAAATVFAAAGAAQAADDSLSYALSSADAEALSLSLNKGSDLEIGIQTQFRYMVNSRDDSSGSLGDSDTTIGFNMRRAKVELKGPVTDSIKGKLKISFDRDGGSAKVEDVYVDWKVSDDVTIRIGQFKLPALREESVSSKRQLAVERSATNETFNQDRSQGIQASFGGDDWRGKVAFSDGFGSKNTPFNSSSEADYAFTGRFEYKLGDATWKQFDQFTSFRGAAAGALIGAAVHWQTMGETNPATTPETDMFLFTADVSYVADGWNLFGAFIFSNTDGGPGADFDDNGAVVQGGIFVTEQTELYARWDAVFSDSARGMTGDDFNSISFGVNHYLVPESHAAKLTLGAGFTLDPTTTSIVSTSDGHNLLADSDDGQFSLIAQAQFLF